MPRPGHDREAVDQFWGYQVSLHSSACAIGLCVVKPQPRQGSLRTNLVEPSDMQVLNPSPSPSDLGVGLP